MSEFYEPVYKGCTSPSTIAGVPTLPFILGTLACAQVGIVGFFFLGLAGVVTIVVIYINLFRWARKVSRDDDHRLLQLLKRYRMRAGHRLSLRYWGAVTYGVNRTKGQR